jgi:prepilin-type N-terminal cleavage/methylation domain-containing protein/prepilin-type processing-associated H-X9-DG protein
MAGQRGNAFTLLELLVVVVVLGLGVAMLAPALARTSTNSPALQCLNNARRIAMGWIMYSDDNNGQLVYNHDGDYAGKVLGGEAWVTGWLDFTSANPDNTNTLMLVDHNQYPYGAYLGQYVRNPAVFKCPADRSMALEGGVQQPRVRSISMNNHVGTESRTWTANSVRYPICTKATQIKSPAIMFITLDEHEASINDGCFFSDPDTPYRVVDYPASYHANAGGFSFADGHSEIHKWLDRRTMPLLQPGQLLNLNVYLPGDKDILWLAQHAAGVAVYP